MKAEPKVKRLQPLDLKLKGFRMYEVHPSSPGIPDYSRRDFYKICLFSGDSLVHYADKTLFVRQHSLFFATPQIPYSWEIESTQYTSFTCLFTEDFIKGSDRSKSLQESPFFKVGGSPLFTLDDQAYRRVKVLFQQMLEEQDSSYVYQDELIRNYLNLIVHQAHKLQPAPGSTVAGNAASRISTLFLDLLERQFPIDNRQQQLLLKNPQDYAQQLNIHVNHLNRSVKQITGQSTRDHIAERILAEARALLLHTDWPIADIAFALGFDYANYFIQYFKRMQGVTPHAFRTAAVV